jgi:hypothetical protein
MLIDYDYEPDGRPFCQYNGTLHFTWQCRKRSNGYWTVTCPGVSTQAEMNRIVARAMIATANWPAEAGGC